MSVIGGIGAGGFDPNQFVSKTQERFQTADTDNDGSVTRQEFEAQLEQVNAPPNAEKMFNRMDSDGDGVITAAEHEAAIERISERLSMMESSGANPNQSVDTFATLLESMSNSETDEEQRKALEEMLGDVRAASESKDFDALRQAFTEFGQLYPRIDVSA